MWDTSDRRYKQALHQSCVNHLLKRCKELQEDHPENPWGREVKAVLRAGLAARDRCKAGELSEHGLASVRGRLEARLGRLIDSPPPFAAAERLARHLATEFLAVFLFLRDPSIDATNWESPETGVGRDGPSSMSPQPENPRVRGLCFAPSPPLVRPTRRLLLARPA